MDGPSSQPLVEPTSDEERIRGYFDMQDNRSRTASPSRPLQLWHHAYVVGKWVVASRTRCKSHKRHGRCQDRFTAERLTETRAETSHTGVKSKNMQLQNHISKRRCRGLSRPPLTPPHPPQTLIIFEARHDTRNPTAFMLDFTPNICLINLETTGWVRYVTLSGVPIGLLELQFAGTQASTLNVLLHQETCRLRSPVNLFWWKPSRPGLDWWWSAQLPSMARTVSSLMNILQRRGTKRGLGECRSGICSHAHEKSCVFFSLPHTCRVHGGERPLFRWAALRVVESRLRAAAAGENSHFRGLVPGGWITLVQAPTFQKHSTCGREPRPSWASIPGTPKAQAVTEARERREALSRSVVNVTDSTLSSPMAPLRLSAN